ncbi:synaptobrevin domain-containing protein [Cavenderia fasciculata]|uniref:Synaptobrevin domain-containing protein n=1 Tax=Cavenderia fasciculata TaxID=261658 RepID=F4Q4J4_CACFS|nr:synaptobrevin domain-containing protein [Cavenderia fasciculata]EGG17843.1 synaptobrevin domain-containing protein [Cavenderia fasciculata]|eukprot:XP_004356327.1 synaptobrevin domain-containing protein [Cavenderia fasciculata]
MPLIYSLVARGSSVLAEFTNTTGNFTTITRRILDLIPPNTDTKMSYVYEKYIFHYLVNDSLTYLCMADQDFGRRIPFAFLEDVKNRFKSVYGDKGKTALAYGMNADFSRTLENLMDYYSNNAGADKLSRTQAEVDEVKNILVSDIAPQLLKRGEKIEILVDRTESLNQQSFKFKKQSKQLKCAMWWKNVKLMLIIALVVAIIIFFIVVMACGGFSFSKCRK